MKLEERIEILEKKVADLEFEIQDPLNEKKEDVVADISVLAHTLVEIAGDCCSKPRAVNLNQAKEGRNFLKLAKESLFRSLENPA